MRRRSERETRLRRAAAIAEMRVILEELSYLRDHDHVNHIPLGGLRALVAALDERPVRARDCMVCRTPTDQRVNAGICRCGGWLCGDACADDHDCPARVVRGHR